MDGRSVPALASGQWAALPAGKHTISFFPYAHSGFSPHTGVTVTLSPGARVYRQVSLPVMTNTAPHEAVAHPVVVHIAPTPATKPVPQPAPKPAPQAPLPDVPIHLRNP